MLQYPNQHFLGCGLIELSRFNIFVIFMDGKFLEKYDNSSLIRAKWLQIDKENALSMKLFY